MRKLIKKIKNIFFENNYPYEGVCPFCDAKIHYMRYSGMSLCYPHFYCNQCSNVIRRKSDFHKVMLEDISEALLSEITESLPNCPCGGRFLPGTNFKCAHCRQEIPNNYSNISRLTDPFMIVVEGAKSFE